MPVEKELQQTIEELRAEIKELRKTIKDMASALSVLTKKDEDAKAFYDRIAEIAAWEDAVRLEEERDAENNDG